MASLEEGNMPIRKAKQYSDRGSIKDLAIAIENGDNLEPTSFELRIQKLINFADTHNDNQLSAAMGFITTNYISDKDALPLSVYRIRQIVSNIKEKNPASIEELSDKISGYLNKDILTLEARAYINKREMVKNASLKKPVFWRVSKQ